MPSLRPSGGVYAATRRAAILAVPGLLGGCHFGLLLFFLDGRLDPSPGALVRTLAAFGLLFGIVSATLLRLLLYRRAEPLRMLPWLTTLTLTIVAVAQWLHASILSFYLTPGLDNRLIKAAAITSLLALVGFYIALLHTVARRRYSWKSRAALVALVVLSPALTLERRLAFVPQRAALPELAPPRTAPALSLAVVGIDGATLDAILPLSEQGQLPFIATLLQQGVYGRLSTLTPLRRLPAWFTVATGTQPYEHGIASSQALTAPFVGPQARLRLWPWASGLHRWGPLLGVHSARPSPPADEPPLWEILQAIGMPTSLVGWPGRQGQFPRTDLALMESLFEESRIPEGGPARTALAREALELRPAIDSVDPALFEPLGAGITDRDRQALVSDLWRESMARRLLERPDDVKAVFLGLPGLLNVSRANFGGYTAVQFDGATEPEQLAAAQAVNGYYRFLDSTLARLWEALPSPRLLVVVAANGVREPSGARRLLSTLFGGSALGGRVDRRSDGVLLLLGDHLRSGTFLDRAELADVAPTVLYGLGLPVPRDTHGSVLTAAFGSTYLTSTPLTFVPSYTPLTRTSAPAAPAPAPAIVPDTR